jgi:hypothetical protein
MQLPIWPSGGWSEGLKTSLTIEWGGFQTFEPMATEWVQPLEIFAVAPMGGWHPSNRNVVACWKLRTIGTARFPTSDNGRPGRRTNGQPSERRNGTIARIRIPSGSGSIDGPNPTAVGCAMCKTSKSLGRRGFAQRRIGYRSRRKSRTVNDLRTDAERTQRAGFATPPVPSGGRRHPSEFGLHPILEPSRSQERPGTSPGPAGSARTNVRNEPNGPTLERKPLHSSEIRRLFAIGIGAYFTGAPAAGAGAGAGWPVERSA